MKAFPQMQVIGVRQDWATLCSSVTQPGRAVWYQQQEADALSKVPTSEP